MGGNKLIYNHNKWLLKFPGQLGHFHSKRQLEYAETCLLGLNMWKCKRDPREQFSRLHKQCPLKTRSSKINYFKMLVKNFLWNVHKQHWCALIEEFLKDCRGERTENTQPTPKSVINRDITLTYSFLISCTSHIHFKVIGSKFCLIAFWKMLLFLGLHMSYSHFLHTNRVLTRTMLVIVSV